MRYDGWHYEKTLLIRTEQPQRRANEFIDACIVVRADKGRNLAADVRVVLKKDWNIYDREVPSQVYAIKDHGDVATFRVAFQTDFEPHELVRAGVLYCNPDARPPRYESSLSVSGEGVGYCIDNRYYHAETDPESGQLSVLAIKTTRHEKCYRHVLPPEDSVQPGVSVVHAIADGDQAKPETVSASGWINPPSTCTEQGPLFFGITREGELAPQNAKGGSVPPRLSVTYKFFADQPYILVQTNLVFPEDTPVFAVQHGSLCARTDQFSHFTFRPVSPDLPITDVEEMGHILIDPQYTQGLPEGLVCGDFLPYDLAWQAFINIYKGPQRKQYGLTAVNLDSRTERPDGDPVTYRPATYLVRAKNAMTWYRAPIHVNSRTKVANVVIVPAGSTYSQTDALLFGPWDIEQWAPGVEEWGKRLNHPPAVEQYPRLVGVDLPQEAVEPLPYGRRADAYTRAGVR